MSIVEKRLLDESKQNESNNSTWKCFPTKMNSPRTLHQAVSIGDHRVVVSGGINAEFQMLKTVEMYDFWLNEVKSLPDLSVERYSHSSVVCDEQVFVIGGCSNFGITKNNVHKSNKSLNSVEFLNMKASHNEFEQRKRHKWKKVANMGVSRFDFTTCATRDSSYIYALGGKSISPGKGIELLSSVERYDIVNDKWEMVAPMQCPRAGHLSVTVDNCIFIFGGITYSITNQKVPLHNTSVEMARTTEIFDISSQSWKLGPPLPFTFSYLVAIAPYGKWIILIGGQQPSSRDNSYLFFNTTTYDWYLNQKSDDLKTPRNEHAQVVLDDKIVVLGGLNTKGKILKTIEFAKIQDFLRYKNDDNLSMGKDLICEQSMDMNNEESILNISVEATLNEIELSLLITELEEDFQEAFVQLGGGASWMESEELQKGDICLARDETKCTKDGHVELRLDGIPVTKEDGEHLNSEGKKDEELLLEVDNKEVFLQENIEGFLLAESRQSTIDDLHGNLKSQINHLSEYMNVTKNSMIQSNKIQHILHKSQLIKFRGQLAEYQKTLPRKWQWILIGLVAVLFHDIVKDFTTIRSKTIQELSLEENIKLAESSITISSAMGQINVAVSNLMSFEIEKSVHQCSLNQLESYFSPVELHLNNVDKDISLLDDSDWNHNRKRKRALGDKISFTPNCIDVRQLQIELAVIKNEGLATLSNTVITTKPGDIRFSIRLKRILPLSVDSNEFLSSKVIAVDVLVGVQNGVLSIANQSKSSLQERIDIERVEAGTMRFTTKEDTRKKEAYFYQSSCLSVKWSSQLKEGMKKYIERTITLFRSVLSDWKMRYIFQIMTEQTLSISKRLQLYTLLRSVPIKTKLKVSPIIAFMKLSSEQSIHSVQDLCEALALRRFDIILKKDYLHHWRAKAKPKVFKQTMKPICYCMKISKDISTNTKNCLS